MSSTPVFEAISDFFSWCFISFEVMGNAFNDALLGLAFVGIAYWMYRQTKYNKIADNDPNQLH